MRETNFYGEVIKIEHEEIPQVGAAPTIPPEPPPVGQGPPSWKHITPEQKFLSSEVLDISGNNGWWFGTGEKHQDAPRRRLYAMNDACRCERCGVGDSAIPWIETHLHIAGRICPNCNLDETLGSLLHLELNRLPKNAIESDFVVGDDKYLTDDPQICELPFWEPGMMVHLGAVMRSGKTTHVINLAEADPDAIYLLLFPRKSLADNVWNERRRHWGSSGRWGLFYGGSDKQFRQIGDFGAMGVLPSLPAMLQALIRKFGKDNMPPVHLFLDEVDFCFELMLANILRRASREIKDLLHQIVEKHGIVTAGQTEFTATLELVAAELGMDPDENLWGYYNTAQPTGQIAELREYPDGEGKKNRLIAGVIEAVADGLREGKPQYVHADGRRTAQTIGSFFEDWQLFDRYHRGTAQNRDLLWRGRIDSAQLLLSSNALDVGVSIRDPNAVAHVVMSENPLHYGSPPSYPQRGLRNREIPPLFFHYIRYDNPLPISPSEAVERAEFREAMKLGEGEQLPKHLIHHLAKRESLKTLADNQIDTYISHNWQRAGYGIKVQSTLKSQETTVEQVKVRKRELREAEKNAVRERALEILDNFEVMGEGEIQRAGEQAKLEPIPTEQIAHEEANAALQTTGWDGIVERRGDDGIALPTEAVFADVKHGQWQCANDLLQAGIDTGKLSNQRRGFIGVHFGALNRKLAADDRVDTQLSFIHRRNDGLIAALLTALLMFLPANSPKTLNEVTPSIHQAFMVEYQGYSLAHWIARGALGDANGLRFLNWGPGAEITVHHLKWIARFIEQFYPARLRIETWTVNDEEQPICLLVQSQDAKVVVAAIKCYLTHAHPEVDLDSGEHLDLFPALSEMPYQFEVQRQQARQMRTAGAKLKEIAEAVGMSTGWVSKQTADIVPKNKKIQQQKAIEMHQQSKTHWAIAKELGVANHTVKRWLNVC